MSESKPIDETPAHRTRRVLSRLGLPDSSPIVWLGILVGVAVLSLVVVGFLVGGLASDMFEGHVEQLRELWTEP